MAADAAPAESNNSYYLHSISLLAKIKQLIYSIYLIVKLNHQ